MSVTAGRRVAWAADVIALFATLVTIYLLSQFLRNSIGVIAPDIAAELNIPAHDIGVLSSAFFFGFAAVQLPLGVAIDRFGAKRCMLVCCAIMVAGTLLFAAGRTSSGLVVARIVMGVGTSCYLMAPLALYARRFAAERFAMLAGLHMAIGTFGALLATAPFAYAVAAIGWRAAFVASAAIVAVSGLMIAIVIREPRAVAVERRETLRENILGLRAAMRVPSVGRLFLMQTATYSCFGIFAGLWGGSYLTDGYGYGLTERGSLLLVTAIAQIIGLTLYGWADRVFGSYRVPVMIGAGLTAALFIVLAVTGTLPRGALLVWLAAFGALSGFTPVVIAHGKALFPSELTGRGMTLLNMGSMGGVFFTQAVSGYAIELFGAGDGGAHPVDAYRLVFALQAAFVIAAVAVYVTARDPLRESSTG